VLEDKEEKFISTYEMQCVDINEEEAPEITRSGHKVDSRYVSQKKKELLSRLQNLSESEEETMVMKNPALVEHTEKVVTTDFEPEEDYRVASENNYIQSLTLQIDHSIEKLTKSIEKMD